ncbi:MAG: PEP-CTERM-box response regulator transcription factor [Gammaproteobacteria bacterium]|nr:PEP-CTERM-box response regulator transcription factor [Gammaproteobacteria bacterium]MCF6260556.1 PEP-CTERM-box response regulator transcription factor [Gammaproteobacteria bacterium]
MGKTKKLRPLLVIEDDPGLQNQLRWCFEGFDVTVAGDRESALQAVETLAPAVVTLDLGLPPDPANASEGLATLEAILNKAPHTKVIVVTGNDDRENAVSSIGMGAYDFYQKPIEPEILSLIIERAYTLYELEAENRQLLQQPSSPLDGVIASSPQMLKLCRMIEKVAPTNATTLLLGESGTGKEVLAKALHQLSVRGDKKFVAINSAAIPETLLESELFGYEKGAFTGANKTTPGKIELAEGGTFFIDEVGDLPQSLQAKMLRFLQERVVERLGGRKEIPVDVRVVCATHQDLPTLIEAGTFREDLYYRISEITLDIPPLREREGDVLLLARVFLNRFSKENKNVFKGFSASAVSAMEKHPWSGNVRELENKIKRAVILAEGAFIEPDDLELVGDADDAPVLSDLRQIREQAERQAILRALALVNDNVTQAAVMLNVTRPTFYDLMKKYKIK